MKQRDIRDTDHSLPDQRQPGNEHAQCRGWGNRDNHVNSRADYGKWIGKKRLILVSVSELLSFSEVIFILSKCILV